MARTASASPVPAASRRGGNRSAAAKAAGAAQHANTENLKGSTQAPQGIVTAPVPQTQASPAPTTSGASTVSPVVKTDDANLVMPHIQHSVLVQAIKAATAWGKAALNTEIAVACAVFIDAGGSDLKAKKELYAVYADAGFDCNPAEGSKVDGKDYKTVNRRINYAAQFFDSMEKDSLKAVMGEARDDAAIQTLVAHIGTKYNLRSMQDVLEAAGVVAPGRQPRRQGPANDGGTAGSGGTQAGGPNEGGTQPSGGGSANETGTSVFQTSATSNPTGQPQGQMDAGDAAMQAALGQAAGERHLDSSKWMRFQFEGATLLLPVDFKTDCLADLGIKLMTAAKEMHGASTVVRAALNEVFKEMVAH